MPTVDLWLFSLDLDRDRLRRFWSFLSEEERARAHRRQGLLRDRFIAGWGQVRCCLASYLSRPPETLRFIRGRYGKPYLLSSEGITFNLAHSGDQLLLAVAREIELGVDLEYRSLRPIHRLATRILTPGEKQYWQELCLEAQREAFYRFWTLKEAVVKADGQGLGLGLDQIGLDLQKRPPRLVEKPPFLRSYLLWEGGWREFQLALACEEECGPLRLSLKVACPCKPLPLRGDHCKKGDKNDQGIPEPELIAHCTEREEIDGS